MAGAGIFNTFLFRGKCIYDSGFDGGCDRHLLHSAGSCERTRTVKGVGAAAAAVAFYRSFLLALRLSMSAKESLRNLRQGQRRCSHPHRACERNMSSPFFPVSSFKCSLDTREDLVKKIYTTVYSSERKLNISTASRYWPIFVFFLAFLQQRLHKCMVPSHSTIH